MLGKVTLNAIGGSGVVLVASDHLSDGTIVAQIPTKLQIRMENAWQIHELQPALEMLWPHGTPWTRQHEKSMSAEDVLQEQISIIQKLDPSLYELRSDTLGYGALECMLLLYYAAFVQGNEFFFAPFVNSLPKVLTDMPNFDEDARALFAAWPAYKQMQEQADAKVEALARLIDGPLRRAAPEAFPHVSDHTELFKRAAWIHGILTSRSHSGRFHRGHRFVGATRKSGEGDGEREGGEDEAAGGGEVTKNNENDGSGFLSWDDPISIVPFSFPNHGVSGTVPHGHLHVPKPGSGSSYVWKTRGATRPGDEVRPNTHRPSFKKIALHCCATIGSSPISELGSSLVSPYPIGIAIAVTFVASPYLSPLQILQSYHGITDQLPAWKWASLYGFVP